jgi:hypothetical protein
MTSAVNELVGRCWAKSTTRSKVAQGHGQQAQWTKVHETSPNSVAQTAWGTLA